MPRFTYKAKSSPSDVVEGSIEAETRDAAVNKLVQLGYFPLEVFEERPHYHKAQSGLSLSLIRKISQQDLGLFTRQLADLLDSGLTLLKSLDIIHNQTQNRHLKEIILDVRNFVQDGGSLSEGLKNHPKIFSNLYTNMVRSGELSGSLDKVLLRLADFSEKEQEVKSKIAMSLVYPTVMILLGIATVFILLTFVIPRLVVMFVELGQSLPLPTIILINVSAFFAHYWWAVAGVVATVVFYLKKMQATHEGKSLIDKFKLNIPFVGDFIKKIELARFARTLGTLLDSGVTIIQSMETVADMLNNELLRIDVQRMAKDIADGASLNNTMLKSSYFPEAITNMVAIGEESGQLEKSLLKIAESYERESDRTVKVIVSLLEPMAILVIGGIVGFIVIAMLLPIFQMNLIVY